MITKEMILERISQEDIMKKYYPGEVIIDQKVCNELRKDRHPDCEFYYSSGTLLFLDFARKSFSGDCFKIAMLATGLPFPDILYRINKDFELNLMPKGFHEKTAIAQYKAQQVPKVPKKKELSVIECETMDWTVFDRRFWNDRGIKLSTASYYDVASCHRVWIHKSGEIFTYHPTDPIYRYLIREPDLMEIYRPYGNKKVKFRSNCPKNIVQGWKQLPEQGEFLIITKAYKDLMNFYEMGYPAVSFGGESTFPEPKILKMLTDRFKNIIIVYDNDEAGKANGSILSKKYNFPLWYIPEEYKVKDTNDFIKEYSYEKYGQIFIPSRIIEEFNA